MEDQKRAKHCHVLFKWPLSLPSRHHIHIRNSVSRSLSWRHTWKDSTSNRLHTFWQCPTKKKNIHLNFKVFKTMLKEIILVREEQGGNLKVRCRPTDNEVCLYGKVIYSARRLIGSRILESAAYCNQIWLIPFYLNSTQKRYLILSFG